MRNLRQHLISLMTLPVFCSLAITGCSQNSANTGVSNLHFYIVTSPINEEQARLAKLFFVHAKANEEYKTQIIVPGNYYTVAEFCENDQPDILVPGTKMNDNSDLEKDAIISKVENSLQEIIEQKKTCTASAISLANIAANLTQAAEQQKGKLVILMQAPWEGRELTEEQITQIKARMDKLAQSDQVERIVLFGVNEKGADRLSSTFAAFNQNETRIFADPASDLPQTMQRLKSIRSEILQIK